MGNKRSQYTKENKAEAISLIEEEGKIDPFLGKGAFKS
jgi:hypothetical protein